MEECAFLEKCAIFGQMCSFARNVLSMKKHAIYGEIVLFVGIFRNITFLIPKTLLNCTLFEIPRIYCIMLMHFFLINVQFLINVLFSINMLFMEKCAIFGEMCCFGRNVPYTEKCALFGEMCYSWRNVLFLEKCAIFGEMCYF
jgi:hypothetical protein